MSSIRRATLYGELSGDGRRSYQDFHGTIVHGRGVFHTTAPYAQCSRHRFSGQCRDGHACGLGVLTSHINTEYAGHEYAEHGPDGHFDGPHLALSAWGTRDFRVFRHGEEIEHGSVRPGGSGTGCTYKYVACAPDDPRLLALIAQVAPVEVCPATAAPSPVLATLSRRCNRGFAGSFCPPQALATAVASEVHTHTARCRCAQLCSFDIQLGLAGRGSRGQPASARGGAHPPAGTKYGGMSAWVAERAHQRPVLLTGTHGIL